MPTIAQNVRLLDMLKEGKDNTAVLAPLRNKRIFGSLHKEGGIYDVLIIESA